MAEIEPLICPTAALDLASVHACWTRLSAPPTLGELVELCLPTRPLQPRIQISEEAGSALVWSDDDDVRVVSAGFDRDTARAVVRLVAPGPFVQVAWVAGRLRLVRGLAAVTAARLAGAPVVPCVRREALTPHELAGDEIAPATLASEAPPTVGHFVRGRAWPVRLRRMRRMIHVSWSEHLIPDR